MYTNVHSSIFDHSQKVETIQRSINRWMDKQIVVYTQNGILFSLKKEWTSDPCCNVDESWDYILSEVSQTAKGWYCVTPLSEAPRAVTLIETESRTLVTRGSGEGRMEGHSVIGREFLLEWWVSSLNEVAKGLELQHQPFQWIFIYCDYSWLMVVI